MLEINVRSWNIGAGVAEWTVVTQSWAKARRIVKEQTEDDVGAVIEIVEVCVLPGRTNNKRSGIWFIDLRHSPRN